MIPVKRTLATNWRSSSAHPPQPQGLIRWAAAGQPARLGQATGTSSILADETILEAGDPTADPEKLLNRKTLAGLTEHELMLALNHDDVDALQAFHGFGPRVAEKIIEFRAKEKFFSSLDELVRVPLIGPTRFRRLVGRESQFYTLTLHSTLRRPAPSPIRLADLRPLNWPAPSVPRVFFGASADVVSEQELSEKNTWHLHTKRIGQQLLFIHTNTHLVTGWAAHLLKALPRNLRRIL